MSKEEKRAPEVRFEGFYDDWKQRKILDIAEETFGGGTPKTSIKKYWDGSFPWIQSSDLKLDEVNNVTPSSYITSDAIKNSAAKVVPKNSIAIVTRVGVGKLAFIRYSYSTSQDFLSLSSLKIDEQFALFSLYKCIKKETNNTQGTSIKGITKKELLNKVIMCPLNSNEQNKIGTLFKQLSDTITLHQRKLDKLQSLKKAELQTLFPKEDEVTPKVRFTNFNEPWKQCKLKDMLKERNEQIQESDNYPLMSFVQGVGVTPKNDRYDRNFLVKDNNKKYKKTEFGDFIYSSNNLETGSIGINKVGKAVISPVYSIFSSKNSIESQFIGILSTRKNFINKMLRFRQGVVYGQWRIHEKDFLNINVTVPSYREQRKVASLFKGLDKNIVLYQTKLEKLQTLKKSFLQKMFI